MWSICKNGLKKKCWPFHYKDSSLFQVSKQVPGATADRCGKFAQSIHRMRISVPSAHPLTRCPFKISGPFVLKQSPIACRYSLDADQRGAFPERANERFFAVVFEDVLT